MYVYRGRARVSATEAIALAADLHRVRWVVAYAAQLGIGLHSFERWLREQPRFALNGARGSGIHEVSFPTIEFDWCCLGWNCFGQWKRGQVGPNGSCLYRAS